MPRYHFNVFDGISSIDEGGSELADLVTARYEAIRLAGNIVADDAQRMKLGEDWRMEVTDDVGLLLFRLDFTVVETPAIRDALANQSLPST